MLESLNLPDVRNEQVSKRKPMARRWHLIPEDEFRDIRLILKLRLREALTRKRWSVQRLSIESRVTFHSVSNMVRATGSMPNLRTVYCVAKALNMRIAELLT